MLRKSGKSNAFFIKNKKRDNPYLKFELSVMDCLKKKEMSLLRNNVSHPITGLPCIKHLSKSV